MAGIEVLAMLIGLLLCMVTVVLGVGWLGRRTDPVRVPVNATPASVPVELSRNRQGRQRALELTSYE